MDLGYGAWFRNHDAAVPVFHRVRAWPDTMRTWHDVDGREHHAYVAVCGIELEAWSFVRGDDRSHRHERTGLVLRVDHAGKFGRQCTRCTAAILGVPLRELKRTPERRRRA